jgi:hypothetical protein
LKKNYNFDTYLNSDIGESIILPYTYRNFLPSDFINRKFEFASDVLNDFLALNYLSYEDDLIPYIDWLGSDSFLTNYYTSSVYIDTYMNNLTDLYGLDFYDYFDIENILSRAKAKRAYDILISTQYDPLIFLINHLPSEDPIQVISNLEYSNLSIFKKIRSYYKKINNPIPRILKDKIRLKKFLYRKNLSRLKDYISVYYDDTIEFLFLSNDYLMSHFVSRLNPNISTFDYSKKTLSEKDSLFWDEVDKMKSLKYIYEDSFDLIDDNYIGLTDFFNYYYENKYQDIEEYVFPSYIPYVFKVDLYTKNYPFQFLF